MKTRVVAGAVVVLSSLLPARPAWSCDFGAVVEPADEPGVSSPHQATRAPVGGVWWVARSLDDTVTAVELEREDDGLTTSIPLDALVSRGPRHFAVPVPAAAVAGDVFTLPLPAGEVRLAVDDDAVEADATAPVIAAIEAVPTSAIEVSGCGPGFPPREEVFFTTVTVDVDASDDLPLDDLLVDAWILEPGAVLPDDLALRALEVFPAEQTGVASVDGVAFHIRREGTFDVHVRVIDPRTGRASSVERVTIVNDRPPEDRAPDFSAWSWGCGAMSARASPALLPLLGLLAWRRRR